MKRLEKSSCYYENINNPTAMTSREAERRFSTLKTIRTCLRNATGERKGRSNAPTTKIKRFPTTSVLTKKSLIYLSVNYYEFYLFVIFLIFELKLFVFVFFLNWRITVFHGFHERVIFNRRHRVVRLI